MVQNLIYRYVEKMNIHKSQRFWDKNAWEHQGLDLLAGKSPVLYVKMAVEVRNFDVWVYFVTKNWISEGFPSDLLDIFHIARKRSGPFAY